MTATKQQLAVKESPILFSGPMVRKLLSGEKTMTRRIVKPQPPSDEFQMTTLSDSTARKDRKHIGAHQWAIVKGLESVRGFGPYFRCPYGYPGNRLWVREAFCSDGEYVGYRADQTAEDAAALWRPSIFMPRWASRITLEITAVRVERLREISEEDAEAEGCTGDHRADRDLDAAQEFRSLWDSINGKRASWESNPWVWVVSFRRIGK